MQVLALPKETLDQLDRIQRNFWWEKDGQKRKGGFIKAWKGICKPISQGGLGIKNPHHFNLALLTKLASRLVTEHDQLWVRLLKTKYFSNSHLLEKSRTSNLSWIWTSIQKGLELIKSNYVWQVKNGASGKIWEDRWVPNSDLIQKVSNVQEQAPIRVQELITEENKWDQEKLNQFFFPDDRIKILALNPRNQEQDIIRWRHHTSGKFSAKNVYNFLANQDQDTVIDRDFSWNKIWKIQAIPRKRLFIWKLS